jgi:hypothetical protein
MIESEKTRIEVLNQALKQAIIKELASQLFRELII